MTPRAGVQDFSCKMGSLRTPPILVTVVTWVSRPQITRAKNPNTNMITGDMLLFERYAGIGGVARLRYF